MLIALISCTKNKRRYPCTAKEMYSESELFSLEYEYAELTCDRSFILSTKYGLLEPDTVIEPYELPMSNFSAEQKRKWAYDIYSKLKDKCDMENDIFIILAGKDYRSDLLNYLVDCRYSIPLMGLDINRQKERLNDLIEQYKQA